MTKEVDQYISKFPSEVQADLSALRELVLSAAPKALESISYGMPTYKTHGKPLVYFAGYKNHIGLYATPSGHSEFEKELSQYKQGKGSVQFPIGELPIDLIKKIIAFRETENEEKYS